MGAGVDSRKDCHPKLLSPIFIRKRVTINKARIDYTLTMNLLHTEEERQNMSGHLVHDSEQVQMKGLSD